MGFVNGFLSYLVLMLVFVAVGGIGIFLGISLRKASNAKADKENAETDNKEAKAEA